MKTLNSWYVLFCHVLTCTCRKSGYSFYTKCYFKNHKKWRKHQIIYCKSNNFFPSLCPFTWKYWIFPSNLHKCIYPSRSTKTIQRQKQQKGGWCKAFPGLQFPLGNAYFSSLWWHPGYSKQNKKPVMVQEVDIIRSGSKISWYSFFTHSGKTHTPMPSTPWGINTIIH